MREVVIKPHRSMSEYGKVCVTGGAGHIGSWLVKKLLERGYIVHATLRNLDEQSKVKLLKSLPGADTRLVLFQADIYNSNEFQHAVQGCHCVFHVATPLQHMHNSQYKNTSEAAVAGAKSIAMSCIRSGTVRRLIYTASVVAASPLKDDGTGFKDLMDETCWTPLNLSFAYANYSLTAYVDSKTLAEKEILKFGNYKNGSGSSSGHGNQILEVVSLACGLVGGGTFLSYTPSSETLFTSHLTNNATAYQSLKFLEELLGKIPVVHIDDVCEAHIFCMENPSIHHGRFLCASSYISSAEIAAYYQRSYPQFHVKQEYWDDDDEKETKSSRELIKWGSSKLEGKGFVYKYDTNMILDGSITCAMTIGDLPLIY